MPKRSSTKRQFDTTKEDRARLAPTKVIRRKVRFETSAAILLAFAETLPEDARVSFLRDYGLERLP